MQIESGNKYLIPVVDSNTEISVFDKSNHLLSHRLLKYQVKINNNTYDLFSLIDGKRTLIEITNIFNCSRKDNEIIDLESAYDIIYQSLAKYGFIVQDNFIVEKRARASYLKLSIILLKPKQLDIFVKYLQLLYRPTVFYFLFIFSSLALTIFIISHYSLIVSEIESFTIKEYIISYVLFGISLFFHELGHISACKYFGANYGGIGFGFYLFSPVMFADVSDIWKLEKKKRMIVNIGGIYFGNLFSLLFFMIYVFYNNIFFLIIPISLTISSLFNLNPLVKYDGYWILSDMIGVPNLHKNSFIKFRNVVSGIIHKSNGLNFSIKDYFLAAYSLISISFIFFFLISVLVINPESVLYFPKDLFTLLCNIYYNPLEFRIMDIVNFIVPVLFYYLVINFSYNMIRNYVKKQCVNRKRF